jgi:hypothetical protein
VTQPIKFLFDECISWKVVEAQLESSVRLCEPSAIVAHLMRKFPPGTKDRDWIPQIADEGGWVIVSMDRGMHGKREERLPILCRSFLVTHVLLSPGLAKRNMYIRTLAIESCWPDLIEASHAPRGTTYSLQMRELKSGVVYRLVKTQDPPPPPDAPPTQQSLFTS